MCSGRDDTALPVPGFPIRTPPDLCLFGDYPEFFAACHVLLRLLPPRHPPHALSILIREDLSTLCSFQGASESRHISRATRHVHGGTAGNLFYHLSSRPIFKAALDPFSTILVALLLELHEARDNNANARYQTDDSAVPRDLAEPAYGKPARPDRPEKHHQRRKQDRQPAGA
jgi:hypothetical protein